MHVLIAYATAHGSTQGVAERIADGLRVRGHRAELRRLGEGDLLGGCDAVVLGSAVHDGRWLPEAAQFAYRNRTQLADRPVWLFSVSSLGERSGAFRPAVARRLRMMRGRHRAGETTEIRRAVRARGHHDFAGVVAADHWPVGGRLVFRMMGGRFGDHRDWAEIDDWTAGIAHGLAAGTPPGPAAPQTEPG